MIVGTHKFHFYFIRREGLVMKETEKKSSSILFVTMLFLTAFILLAMPPYLSEASEKEIGFVAQPTLDFYRVSQFSEGLAGVVKDGEWGYVNEFGETVIDFKYDHAFPFKNGLAAVEIDDMIGYINKSGELVIPAIYDIHYYTDDGPVAGDFAGGVAIVANAKGYGVIDNKGTIIVPLKYDYIGAYYEDIARIELDGKWGFIDKTGSFITEMKWSKCSDFSEGLAVVIDDGGKQFYIDKSGNVTIDLQEYIKQYKHARIVRANEFHEGYAVIKINYMSDLMDFLGTNKQIVVDKTGKIKAELSWFDTGNSISNGTLTVYQNTQAGSIVGIVGQNMLYGLIDIETLEYILEPEYTEISDFKEGFAIATYKDKVGRFQTGVVDTEGKTVIEFKRYNFAQYISPFSEGFAAFGYDEYGYYDQNGKVAWSRKTTDEEYYIEINNFHEGFAFVKINRSWGILTNSYGDYKDILEKRSTPGTVSNLTVVKASSKSIAVKWDSVSDAKTYQVFRSNQKSKGYTMIATTDKNTYTDKKVTAGKTYYYKVRAVNAYDKLGKDSKVLTARAK